MFCDLLCWVIKMMLWSPSARLLCFSLSHAGKREPPHCLPGIANIASSKVRSTWKSSCHGGSAEMQGTAAVLMINFDGGGDYYQPRKSLSQSPAPGAPRGDRQGAHAAAENSDSQASPEATSSATGTRPRSSPTRGIWESSRLRGLLPVSLKTAAHFICSESRP